MNEHAAQAPLRRYEPFKAAVEARDLDALMACFRDDAWMKSPALFGPKVGSDEIRLLLAGVMQVFEGFTYVDVLDQGDRAGLVFATRVGDRAVEGWDYLTFDDDGLVTSLTVMLRPLSGLQAVVERMGELLAHLDNVAD